LPPGANFEDTLYDFGGFQVLYHQFTWTANQGGVFDVTFRPYEMEGGSPLYGAPKIYTITVNSASGNHPPIANDQSVATDQDTSIDITLTGSDEDGDTYTFSLVSSPSGGSLGTLNPNTGEVTYAPNSGFSGSDSFTFRVNDGEANSSVATVSITVNSVNNAPTANNQSVTTDQNVPISGALTGNDVDGNVMTFYRVANGGNGYSFMAV